MKEVIDTVSVALANGDTENVGNVVMQEVNRTLLSAGGSQVGEADQSYLGRHCIQP